MIVHHYPDVASWLVRIFLLSRKIRTSPFGLSVSAVRYGRTNYVTLAHTLAAPSLSLLASPLLPTTSKRDEFCK